MVCVSRINTVNFEGTSEVDQLQIRSIDIKGNLCCPILSHSNSTIQEPACHRQSILANQSKAFSVGASDTGNV